MKSKMLMALSVLTLTSSVFAACNIEAARDYAVDSISEYATVKQQNLQFLYGPQAKVKVKNIKIGSYATDKEIIVFTTYDFIVSGAHTPENGTQPQAQRDVFSVRGNCIPNGDGVGLSPLK